jgi:hypothetical protein
MSGSTEIAGWVSQFPEVVAILLVAGGWILAHFARRGVATAVALINEHSIRWSSRNRPVLSAAFGKALQQIVYWGLVVAFIILALSSLESGPLNGWIDQLWVLTLHVLAALVILAAGHILGSMARSLLTGFSSKKNLAALPRLAYIAIVGISLVMALSHLGLDVTFITQIALILTGVCFAGMALAFALGARTLVANLAAQDELNRYKTGDRLLVENVEGTVIEINRTGLVLSTEKGLARIPAVKFAESVILLIDQDSNDE